MAKEESWHRRQAIVLASQLPENIEDARIVLRLVMQIADDFLAEPEPAQAPNNVLALVRDSL
jgi:hypothetical protein